MGKCAGATERTGVWHYCPQRLSAPIRLGLLAVSFLGPANASAQDPQIQLWQLQGLARAYDDPDPLVRIEATRQLGWFSFPKDGQASDEILDETGKLVPRIISFLDDEDPSAVRCAACAVGRIGVAVEDAVPKLIDLLKHPDSAVQFYSALALGNMGKAAGPAVPSLVELLSDNDAHEMAPKEVLANSQLGWTLAVALVKSAGQTRPCAPLMTCRY